MDQTEPEEPRTLLIPQSQDSQNDTVEKSKVPRTPLSPQSQDSRNDTVEKSTALELKANLELKAYRKLMDHLDDINAKNCTWQRHVLRLVKLLVLGALVAILVYSLKVEPTDRHHLLHLRIWRWVAMAIMLYGVFSVVPVLTLLISWPFKSVFRTHRYALYFLHGLKRSVDVTLWSCLVLFGWYVWFRPHLKHVHGNISVIVCHQITRFLIAFCIGSALWTLKTALYLKLEADLYYGQLFHRIRETAVFLNAYELLKKMPPPKDPPNFLEYDRDTADEFNKYYKAGNKTMKKIWLWLKYVTKRKWRVLCGCDTRERKKTNSMDESRIKRKKTIWKDVSRMKRSKVPIWILVRLSEEYLKEVKELRKRLGGNCDQLINDDHQLLEKATDLFKVIKGYDKDQHVDRCDEINEQDLAKCDLSLGGLGYLIDSTQPGAGVERSVHQQENGAIKVEIFLYWAVRMYKKCWGLERTLQNSRSAFVTLNRMLSAFLLVIMAIIWLLLSKIVNTGQLALLFAPFLATSFMYENSSKHMLNGIIFAFAMHPFDVGDRVIIEDIQMRVKEVRILTSVFFKYDTGVEVIFPNSKLATTKIFNLDITPDQNDKLDFVIDADTPLEDIKDLELKLQKLLDEKLYYAKVVKNAQDPAFPHQLKITIHFKYLVSYLTLEKKSTHKSHILSMIIGVCKEMEDNKQDYPLKYKPYVLELTTNEIDLSVVESFKRHILESLGKKYIAKAVMTDLSEAEHKIKMAVYVGTKTNSNSEASTGDPNQAEKPLKRLITSYEFADEMDFFASLPYQDYHFYAVKVTKDDKTIYEQ